MGFFYTEEERQQREIQRKRFHQGRIDQQCRDLADSQEKERDRLTAKRETLQANPFDARTEVSADAKYVADKIVRHLWTIFVLLPIVSIILYEMAK